MPKSAQQIAQEALLEEERPIRQRQAEQALQAKRAVSRRASSVRSAAKKRLAKSPIPKWFPDVEWKFVEYWHNLDVWKADDIQLGIHEEKGIFFLRCKTWVDDPDGSGRRVDGYELNYPVRSVADVGRHKRDYDAALVWPDSANWSD